MKDATKSALTWLFIILAVYALISFSSVPNQVIGPGDFQKMIEAGSLRKIDIYDTGNVYGELKIPRNNLPGFSLKIPPVTFREFEDFRKETESKNPGIIINYKTTSGGLGSLLISWAPYIIMIAFFIFFMRQMQSGGNKALSFGKSKAKLSAGKKVFFKDVAGQEEAKEELAEIVEFLKEPQKFQRLGGRIPKGVLLMGPPGVGKTLLAGAVAGEANAPFFSISGSDFVEMFVGVGASRVRDMFQQGKANAPCIIFIDEIDAVGRHRGAGIGGSHDEREQTLNQLLSEMDGFESNEGVIIIAATNRPDVLDPALLRPGRFDRRVVLTRPDIKGREEILKVHSQKIPTAEDVQLSKVARGTTGFSGADLANLVNEAALNAARYNQKTVTNEDFQFAADKVMMGSERRSMVISDEEKKTTAIHEAGHALVAISLPNADPVHRVTIIPRGMALGLTQQLPEEDKHNYSKDYLTDRLTILMGGRCAEEILLDGQQTTGAGNDIERATELARRMICEWGMSYSLGPQNFVSKENNLFLGRSLAEKSHDYSELTAQKIDEEVTNLTKGAYKKATEIIRGKIEVLIKIKDALLEHESLDSNQIRKLAGLEP